MVGVARPKNEEWSSPFQEGNIGGDKTHSGVFPRSHDSHGYNLPKVHHALAKMPDYICEFRTGMNFYSGPGEVSHKWFVKAPGLKMQQHVSEFAIQTADQYYSMMTIAKATWFVDIRSTRSEHKTKPLMHVMKPQYAVMGQYSVYIVPNETIRLKCTKTNKHVKKVGLDERLVGVMISAIELLDTLVQKCMVMKVRWTNTMHIHFTTVQNGTIVTTQLQYYPSKIPGFIRHENEVRAVVQCSVRPIPWSMLEQKFICSFELCSEHGEEQIVPMSSRRSDPLCVVKDYGATENKYLLVLLKGQWSEYFARFVTRVNG